MNLVRRKEGLNMLKLKNSSLSLYDKIELTVAIKPSKNSWRNGFTKREINQFLQYFLEVGSNGNFIAAQNAKSIPNVIHFYRSMAGDSIVITFYANAIINTRDWLCKIGFEDDIKNQTGLMGENYIPNIFTNFDCSSQVIEQNRKDAYNIIHSSMRMMAWFQRATRQKKDDYPRLALYPSIRRCEVCIDTYVSHYASIRQKHLNYLKNNYKKPYRVYEYEQNEYNWTGAIEVRKNLNQTQYQKLIGAYAKTPNLWRFELPNSFPRQTRKRLGPTGWHSCFDFEEISVYELLDNYKTDAINKYINASWEGENLI